MAGIRTALMAGMVTVARAAIVAVIMIVMVTVTAKVEELLRDLYEGAAVVGPALLPSPPVHEAPRRRHGDPEPPSEIVI
jgi:hypothetical protein